MVVTEWTPTRKLVSDVSNAIQAVVTTTEDHEYLTGQKVVINVSDAYGMELKSVVSPITVLSSTQFLTDIDTRSKSSFSVPASRPYTEAQVSPISTLGIVEYNNIFYNSTPGGPS
jgi:hypothetical protein